MVYHVFNPFPPSVPFMDPLSQNFDFNLRRDHQNFFLKEPILDYIPKNLRKKEFRRERVNKHL